MMGTVFDWAAGFDHAAFELFNKTLTASYLDAAMPYFSDLRWWIGPLIVFWLVFFIRSHRRGRLIAIGCFLVIAATDQVSNNVLKPAVARIRPCNVVPETHLYLDGHWQTTDKWALTTYKTSFSFPSSHATNVGGQAMYWSYFFPQTIPLFLAAALLIGFSRVYLGVHWPLDVFAGYIFGAIIAMLIAWFLKRWILPDEENPTFRGGI
jgi:undecaprenyl-diphosphatase